MAKVTPSHLFTSVSGKLCSKEGTYIAYNQKTGKMYSAVRHTSGNANTDEAHEAIKTAFTNKAKLTASWWNKNKASNTDAYQMVIKAYNAQSKIGNPYSYLRTLVTDDLKVVLSGTDITNGATAGSGTSASGSGASASQGGSSSSQGGSSSSQGSDGDFEG